MLNIHSEQKKPFLKAHKVLLLIIAGLVLIILIVFGIVKMFDNQTPPFRLEKLSIKTPDDCVSSLYQLTAGKSATNKAYTFTSRIGMTDLEDGEVLVLGIGLEYIIDEDGNEELFYIPLEAEVDDGVASATFTPADYLEAKEQMRCRVDSTGRRREIEGLQLGFFKNYAFQREGKNSDPGSFRILISSYAWKEGLVNENIADGLITDLENAYQYYVDQGYSFEARTSWPVEVNMKYMGERNGTYVPIKTLKYSTLTFNMALFSKLPDNLEDPRYYNAGENLPLVIHEVGHLVQHCYTTLAGNCTWTDEAASTYYEWKTGGDVEDALALSRLETLDGVYPWASTAEHGYGRMPLFQYLDTYVSPGFITKLYTESPQGIGYGTYVQWCDAITELCGSPKNYATDYYNKLLTDQLAYPYNAQAVYRWINDPTEGEDKIGQAVLLDLPESGSSLDEIFTDGKDTLDIGTYIVTAYRFAPQLLALQVNSGELPAGVELWVSGSPYSEMSAYEMSKSVDGDIKVLPGDGHFVILEDFAAKTKEGYIYLIQLVGLHGKMVIVDNKTYSVTISLVKSGKETEPTEGGDETSVTETEGSSEETSVTETSSNTGDCCADEMPEVAGIQFYRLSSEIPNARSGQISEAPDMRIDAFNIIGGRLIKPSMIQSQNETFVYMNEGYCVAGETVGLEMVASARDREQDSIEYNIISNTLEMKLTFYDQDGKMIGEPVIRQSPEDGKEHTISDAVSAVVPDNARSVRITGSFNHFYGAYGDYHSASVSINLSFYVCNCTGHPSAIDAELPEVIIPEEKDEDAEAFWSSMTGVWMHYNDVGQVEYFVFGINSSGEKSLTVGTVETGRSEPSDAITVSTYSLPEYEVIYRYEGIDYKLYFDASQVSSGTVNYSAHSPGNYRAFDYVGANMEEAMDYYYTYYSVG